MKKWLMLFVLVLLIVGCSKNEEHANHNTKDEAIKEVRVEIKTNPEKLHANEAVEVQAIVTQEGEMVEDADDVKFEVWKEGNDKHEMLEAKHKGEGVYAITKTFPEDGVYHVVAHTNARDLHVMPEVKLTVGSQEAAQTSEAQQSGESGHSHSKAQIALLVREATAKQQTKLLALVRHDESPLDSAKVQFEVWKEGSEKHEYVAAVEAGPGQYAARHSFAEAGSYRVKVHVEKADLHDHIEQGLTVK